MCIINKLINLRGFFAGFYVTAGLRLYVQFFFSVVTNKSLLSLQEIRCSDTVTANINTVQTLFFFHMSGLPENLMDIETLLKYFQTGSSQ